MYSYAMNNPVSNTDPTGLDCIYFNDAGNGVESDDQKSNSKECGSNGGDWINGTVLSAAYFADSDTFGFRSSDSQNNYLTYANAPGTESDGTTCSGNCDTANGYLQSSNGTPDLTDDQRTQQLVQGVAQDTRSLPWVCNAGLNLRAQIPNTPLSVGVSADRNGVHPMGRASATSLYGGLGVSTNGQNTSVQVTVPFSAVLNGSVSTGQNQVTLGLSKSLNFGGKLSAGASLTFGYLGDANCR